MPRNIKYIVVHCTAGNQQATEADLRHEFQCKKWVYPGYHYVVFADGRVTQMLDEAKIANGVKGYGEVSIHVAYTGGIDKQGKPQDNRTDIQRQNLRIILQDLHHRYPEAQIVGHRDLAPKDCPCFDAKTEYADI